MRGLWVVSLSKIDESQLTKIIFTYKDQELANYQATRAETVARNKNQSG
jgi:hypothetical protein